MKFYVFTLCCYSVSSKAIKTGCLLVVTASIWSKHNQLGPWRQICATLRDSENTQRAISVGCVPQRPSAPLAMLKGCVTVGHAHPVSSQKLGKLHMESSQILSCAASTLCQKSGERFYSKSKHNCLGLSQLRCLKKSCLLPISQAKESMKNEGSPGLPMVLPLKRKFYSNDHTMAVQLPGFFIDRHE